MIDLEAYFARIGYTGPCQPTTETLQALQMLHPAKIPFEAIDALLGRRIDLSPEAVADKLVSRKRGGYCFEQNNLFKNVLSQLGFHVESLIARVYWRIPAAKLPTARTHMVLRVSSEGKQWLADVGFGSIVPTTPLVWSLGEVQSTAHETYRLTQEGEETILEAKHCDNWAPVYRISPEQQLPVDYELASWFTSTHPRSRFCRELVVACTTPRYRAGLLENRLTIRSCQGEVKQEFLTVNELKDALFDIFGLAMEKDWLPVLEKAVIAGESLAARKLST